MSFMVLALVLLPLLAALIELGLARLRPERRSGAVAVAGAVTALAASTVIAGTVAFSGPVALGPIDAPWLAADSLTVVLTLLVSSIGVTVLSYGHRSLDPGDDGVRMAAAGSAVLAATMTVAAAGRLSVLIVAWVATTIAVLALLHRPDDAGRRTATGRALGALGPADLGLVTAGGIVFAASGDLGLQRLGVAASTLAERQLAPAGLPGVSALDAVAVLIVLAALARASQLPAPGWLAGTLAAPTPTSALLHAGVVNAGAVLLLRTLDLVGAAPAALWLLAVASLATIGISLASLHTRHDTKGSLATSTSAQMGFMLLAVSVGAPLAALTHLVGHALYKSARFLGAGDTIGAAVRRRADAAPPTLGWNRSTRLASSIGVVVVVAGATAQVVHGAEAWIVGGALAATAGVATWAWLDRAPVGAGHFASGVVVVTVLAAGYLALVGGFERIVGGAVPEVGVASAAAPAALAVLVAMVVGLLGAARHPALAPRLAAAASCVGRPPIAARARPAPVGTSSGARLDLRWS